MTERLLPNLHVHAEYPRIRQRFVIHAVVQSPEQLVTPQETGGRVFGKETHGFSEIFPPFLWVELLLLFIQEFIETRIGITDSRSFSGVKILVQRGARVLDRAATHIYNRRGWCLSERSPKAWATPESGAWRESRLR
jgi:hypothetical protein